MGDGDRQDFREYVADNETVEELYHHGDRDAAIRTAVIGYCAENDVHGQGTEIVGGFAPHVVDDIHGGDPTPVWSCPKIGHTQQVVVGEQPVCHECNEPMEQVGESNV